MIKSFEEFNSLNEGKVSDVKSEKGELVYRGEKFASFNSPKRYVGKKKFKYRVLAKEGEKVKPINFGSNQEDKNNYNKLDKKYWDINYK